MSPVECASPGKADTFGSCGPDRVFVEVDAAALDCMFEYALRYGRPVLPISGPDWTRWRVACNTGGAFTLWLRGLEASCPFENSGIGRRGGSRWPVEAAGGGGATGGGDGDGDGTCLLSVLTGWGSGGAEAGCGVVLFQNGRTTRCHDHALKNIQRGLLTTRHRVADDLTEFHPQPPPARYQRYVLGWATVSA